MRTLSLLRTAACAALLLPFTSHAQQLVIPNASFETWSQRSFTGITGPVRYQAPQTWDTGFLNLFRIFFTGDQPQFTRSTTAHTGAASARIFCPSTDSIGSDMQLQANVSPTQLPAAITGWVNTNALPTSGDSSTVPILQVSFWRHNAGQVEFVGETVASVTSAQAGTWQQFTRVIQYIPNSPLPDSMSISLMLPPNPGGPTREALFDDLAFQGTVVTGLTPDHDAVALALYPTAVAPAATAHLTFTAPRAGTATVRLTDALGRAVGAPQQATVSAGPTELPLPAANRAPGLYWLTLNLPDGAERRIRFVQE